MKKAREEMPDIWLIFLDPKFSEEDLQDCSLSSLISSLFALW
jgi:hypothetical protein